MDAWKMIDTTLRALLESYLKGNQRAVDEPVE